MGSEDYYFFVTPGNTEFINKGIAAVNGKKVGVNKDSIQEQYYLEWAEKNGVEAELIELTVPENESFAMLQKGELDTYISIDGYGNPETAVPFYKLGSSDYYFAVSNQRPDVFEELENALNRINNENRYFNQQLYEKYMSSTGANLLLSPTEKDWLASHGAIKVGYVDNYLPFCDRDGISNDLNGALRDFLDYASSVIQNAELKYDPIPFDTLQEALDTQKR